MRCAVSVRYIHTEMKQRFMRPDVSWCKMDHTRYCGKTSSLRSCWTLNDLLWSGSHLQDLTSAECHRVVNHEARHSKSTTIMMSKRRNTPTPHIARQRSFCQIDKNRGVWTVVKNYKSFNPQVTHPAQHLTLKLIVAASQNIQEWEIQRAMGRWIHVFCLIMTVQGED